MGVPQGSTLGFRLFLHYINNLSFLCIYHLSIFFYADDTSLIFKIDGNKENYNEVNYRIFLNLLCLMLKNKIFVFQGENLKIKNQHCF